MFDLGNVLVRLDSEACVKAFARLGLAQLFDGKLHPDCQVLMQKLGLGLVSTQEFCEEARRISGLDISDEAMIAAACAMLVEIPSVKKETLLRLRSHGKRVFLLSNTIDAHWDYCVEHLFPYKGHGVDDYFEQTFLSQRMHLAKPDPAIFHAVAQATGIKAEETLFIDDLAANCEAASRSVGWHVFQNTHFNDWLSLPLFTAS